MNMFLNLKDVACAKTLSMSAWSYLQDMAFEHCTSQQLAFADEVASRTVTHEPMSQAPGQAARSQ